MGHPCRYLRSTEVPTQGNGFLLPPSPTGHTDLGSPVPGAKGISPPPPGTSGPPSPQRRVTSTGDPFKGNAGKVLRRGKGSRGAGSRAGAPRGSQGKGTHG